LERGARSTMVFSIWSVLLEWVDEVLVELMVTS
jgi:hypothetical protein